MVDCIFCGKPINKNETYYFGPKGKIHAACWDEYVKKEGDKWISG